MFVYRVTVFWMVVVMSAASVCAAANGLENVKDRQSYSIGLNIGMDLKENLPDMNIDLLLAGIRDAFTGSEWKIPEEIFIESLTSFYQEQQNRQMEMHQKAADENRKAGQEFLEKNALTDGITVTATGLQYRVVKEGTGKKPVPADRVQVHYRGIFVDGTEFDSSHARGEPVVFVVDQVIPGWTEILQLMSEGASYTVYIPPELGYGTHGAGNVIGPNATLIFDIELLKINP